jgi:hypothetical protein
MSVNYQAACRRFHYRLQADSCVINVAAVLCAMFMYIKFPEAEIYVSKI